MVGMLMFTMGLFTLAMLIRYIPVSIVIGFTKGIAVLIALSQLPDALAPSIVKIPGNFFGQVGMLARHAESFNP